MLAALLSIPSFTSPTAAGAAKGGLLHTWGDDSRGQHSDQPTGRFIALADGGFRQSLAIRTDGTLALWGGVGEPIAVPEIPVDLQDDVFVHAVLARSHALALRIDGTVAAWGQFSDFELEPPEDLRFRALAAGGRHSIGLALDGSLHAWGSGASGQTNVPPGEFTAIAAKVNHTIALRSDGTLFGWGDSAANIFADWTPDGQGRFYVPGVRFRAIAAGVNHVLAITVNNRVMGWGDNSSGQLDPPEGERFREVGAGLDFSVGITVNQRLVAWGSNDLGQTDVPHGRFVTVAAGVQHATGIERD
jgi:alpha-tubulin suppressor-like RCC1 family protein